MHVIYTGSEVLSTFLESVIAPGFEVTTLNQELDSGKVDSVVIILNPVQFSLGMAFDVISRNIHKFKSGCEVKIIVV